MVMDREPYRYQKFISDVAGQDVDNHNGSHEEASRCVRNWLRTESRRTNIPGSAEILRRYQQFQQQLPTICLNMQIQVQELTFADFLHAVFEWLKTNAPGATKQTS